MAGIATTCYYLTLSSTSTRKTWLELKTNYGRATPIRRRNLSIRAEVNFVNAEEAKKLIAVEGYAVLDVRDKSQFDRAHIKSCYHVPLFIENTDNDPGTIVKRTLHNNFSGLFFGLPFTKLNPEFVQSVKSQFSPESKLLLVCQEGLRSTAAANKLEQAGFQNIACITSGLQAVKPGTFDSVGKAELQDAGKAGLVTIQGKISAVLGTVLICAYLFITLFPDQAEKLLLMSPVSTAGCQFGESCHFLHYVPGGYNAVAQMMNLAPAVPPASRNVTATAAVPHGSGSQVKTRLCNKFSGPEGCKYGDKCHFAHGEWELGKPIAPSQDDPRSMAPLPGRMGSRMEPPPPSGPAATFGASATAKISVDASLAGAIIGKGGVHSKQICRQTGAKLSIREHESDPSLRNIELEGSFEQIKEASAMVRELISSLGPVPGPAKTPGAHGGQGHPGSNYKTKLCDNFAKGSCTFGERCHFAHGAAELRKSVV
ncbi:hypothetical protein GOBAR_DD14476 [Gossypium barbadense]|nr:hypothetical protein GOBAR_DD14476 [Gossypium barbadense]